MAARAREAEAERKRQLQRFDPELAHSESWWRSTDFEQPLLADGELSMTVLARGADPWVLGLAKWELDDLSVGEPYWLAFPTAGDLLLWLRWLWLPMVCHGHEALGGDRSALELAGPPGELAAAIDELPWGDDAEACLGLLAPSLRACRLCWSPPVTIGPLRHRDDWLAEFAARQREELPYGPA